MKPLPKDSSVRDIAQRQIALKAAITKDRWDWEAQARQMFAKDWTVWAASLLPQLRNKRSKLTIDKKQRKAVISALFNVGLFGYEKGAVNGLEALGFTGKLKKLIRKSDLENIVFWLRDEEVIANIRERATKAADWTMSSAVFAGNDIVAKTLERGGSINEARQELAALLSEKVTGWKSYQIANTEFHVGLSNGRYDVFRRSGVEYKRWLTAGDNRVRYSHMLNEMEGWIQIDKEFPNGAIHPGDGPGSINCFTSGNVSILTKEGWDELRNIKPGRMVMTHLGEFKPVTRLFRGKSTIGDATVKVQFGDANSVKSNCLTVTPEHPFLTQRGWIVAGELAKSDTLMILATECPYCGKLKAHYHNACSKSCASHHIATAQWADPEHRANVGDKAEAQMVAAYASGSRNPSIVDKARSVVFERYGSSGFLGVDSTVNVRGRKAVVKKYGSQGDCLKALAIPALIDSIRKGARTSIEKSMHKYLTKLGVTFIEQFSVGRRRVDFYIPDQKLFIECDGWFFHQDKESERSRDLEILLKYPDHSIKHYLYHGEVTVESFTLETLNHAGAFKFIPCPIREITKRVPTKVQPLYNFAVRGAESYVSNGVISHNCRCILEAKLDDPSLVLNPWDGRSLPMAKPFDFKSTEALEVDLLRRGLGFASLEGANVTVMNEAARELVNLIDDYGIDPKSLELVTAHNMKALSETKALADGRARIMLGTKNGFNLPRNELNELYKSLEGFRPRMVQSAAADQITHEFAHVLQIKSGIPKAFLKKLPSTDSRFVSGLASHSIREAQAEAFILQRNGYPSKYTSAIMAPLRMEMSKKNMGLVRMDLGVLRDTVAKTPAGRPDLLKAALDAENKAMLALARKGAINRGFQSEFDIETAKTAIDLRVLSKGRTVSSQPLSVKQKNMLAVKKGLEKRTLVVDQKSGKWYLGRGFGNFNLSDMVEVALDELESLID